MSDFYEKDGKNYDTETDERIIRQEGKTYRENSFGEWIPDTNIWGQNVVETNVWGNPVVETDWQGNEKIETDFWGSPIVSPDKK